MIYLYKKEVKIIIVERHNTIEDFEKNTSNIKAHLLSSTIHAVIVAGCARHHNIYVVNINHKDAHYSPFYEEFIVDKRKYNIKDILI